MTAAALLALLAATTVTAAQEPPVTRSREFTIRINTPERPSEQVLWVSRDAGRTWHPAGKLGVKSVWAPWANGVLRCRVTVPDDGVWHFHAQLGDAVGNLGPAPENGAPAPVKMQIQVLAEGRLEWRAPRGTAAWSAGDRVTLRWTGHEAGLRDRTVSLAYSLDGGTSWITITRGLPPAGSYAWVVPNRDVPGMLLKLRGLTVSGRETDTISDPIRVKATRRPDLARARALYDRARILAAQSKTTEARLKYEEALSAWGDFAEVHNDLGHLYAKDRDYIRGLEHFLQARRICPSDARTYVNAASMEIGLGLLDDAMADLRDAVALGLEKDERTAVLAGEMLWRIAATSPNELRAADASRLILSIRMAAPATRERARQVLEKAKQKP